MLTNLCTSLLIWQHIFNILAHFFYVRTIFIRTFSFICGQHLIGRQHSVLQVKYPLAFLFVPEVIHQSSVTWEVSAVPEVVYKLSFTILYEYLSSKQLQQGDLSRTYKANFPISRTPCSTNLVLVTLSVLPRYTHWDDLFWQFSLTTQIYDTSGGLAVRH